MHARRRSELAPLELLEGRALMAYSALGFSLPDLTISGVAAPAASWGNTLAVTVTLNNIGSETINEPLALAPGSQSTADAAPTTVAVYASTRKNAHRQVLIGTFATPYLPQERLGPAHQYADLA